MKECIKKNQLNITTLKNIGFVFVFHIITVNNIKLKIYNHFDHLRNYRSAAESIVISLFLPKIMNIKIEDIERPYHESVIKQIKLFSLNFMFS